MSAIKAATTKKHSLDIKFNNKNIHDVLNMTIEEAAKYFSAIPVITRKLNTLLDVDLSPDGGDGGVQIISQRYPVGGCQSKRLLHRVIFKTFTEHVV